MADDLIGEALKRWPIGEICKRPWRQSTLMIYDADGNVVMHLGGMHWDGKTADPYFLTALAAFIVDAVNADKGDPGLVRSGG